MIINILALALALLAPAQMPVSAQAAWIPATGAVLTWDGADTLCVGRRSLDGGYAFLGCGPSGFTDATPTVGDVYVLSPDGGGEVVAVVPLVGRAYLPFVGGGADAEPYPIP